MTAIINKPTLQHATGSWTLDTDKTVVQVTVKKMKLITVDATLKVISGTINVVDGKVDSVEVTVDAGSYNSGSKMRDAQVLGKHFLDAANHPTITFTAPTTNSVDRVQGEVTVNGTTTPLVFTIDDLSLDDGVARVTASATADRFTLGVDTAPAFVIGAQLDITVDATATRNT